jgi:O-antigen/teichoic acid export membrane protein
VALTPLVYKHYRNPETPKQVARLFHWFVSIALSGCLFLTLFAKEFLILFATPEYLRGAGLVIYLAPALLLSQMYIFAPGIGIRKKTHWQLWITILAAIVSVAGNFLLVPVWGTVGAAVATLLSSVVFFAAWLIFSQRLYSIPYSWLQILFSTTAFIACAALGTHLETMGFNAVEALIAKLTLHLILVAAIILSRLIPVSEIRELIRFLQRPRTS